MKKLALLLLITLNVQAQMTDWRYTCKELPPEHENIVIWYSAQPNITPDRWDKAFYGNDGNYYLEDDRIIPAAQVSNWYIPTAPVSYCGAPEPDGGELE